MLPIFPVYVTALIHIGHLLVACLMVAQVAFNSLGLVFLFLMITVRFVFFLSRNIQNTLLAYLAFFHLHTLNFRVSCPCPPYMIP